MQWGGNFDVGLETAIRHDFLFAEQSAQLLLIRLSKQVMKLTLSG